MTTLVHCVCAEVISQSITGFDMPLAKQFDSGDWLVRTIVGGVIGGIVGLVVWVIRKAAGGGDSSTLGYDQWRSKRKRKIKRPKLRRRRTYDEDEDAEEGFTTTPRPQDAASGRESRRSDREIDREEYDDDEPARAGGGRERASGTMVIWLSLAISMIVLIGFVVGGVILFVVLTKPSSGPSGSRPLITQSTPPQASSSSPPFVPSPSPPRNPPDQTVKLPGTVTATAVGAQGRLLILLMPDSRQLVVFDVEKKSVVKLLPVASANVKIAAGRDKLMIVEPETATVERWSLTTFEKETAAQIPMKVPPIAAAMGSASDGPLVISGVDFPRLGETAFVDVQNMKRIAVAEDPHRIFDSSPTVFLRASANGRVFTCEDAAMSGKMQCLAWNNGVIKMCRGGGGNLPVPGPDGAEIYTTQGRFGNDLKAATGVEGHCLPACRGGYFLAIAQDQGELSIYRNASERPLRRVTGLDEIVNVDNRKGMPLDMRVFYLADAKLLITVSSSSDSLLLRKVDAAGN